MPTLKDLRERAMMSQSEVAAACGVHPHTISFWETGYSRPTPVHQRSLVKILNCQPEELLAALKETRALRKERDKPPEDEKERPAA